MKFRALNHMTSNRMTCLRIAFFSFLIFIFPTLVLGQGKTEPKQEKEQASASDDQEAQDKDGFSEHMRISRDHRGRAWSMDTAITRFEYTKENGKVVYVDLIGAVHVGEKEYYQALNERFKEYDSMLYELVAPEGTVIPKGGGDRDIANPIAGMQVAMMSGLDLSFQLEEVDYSPDNFVHADMTPEEFAKSWEDNNESIGRILLKSMGHSMAVQSKGGGSNLSLLTIGLSRNPTLKLRRIAAEQMMAMDAGMAIFEGDKGSTIIDHRNAKAMKVLMEEIEKGKQNLAIFYGAGHLNDMQERLENDFQMRRGGKTWLKAWKLREPREKKPEPESKQDSESK